MGTKDEEFVNSARLLAKEAAMVLRREGITDLNAALEFLGLTAIAAFYRREQSAAKRSSNEFEE